jgi:hypothetical protein
VANFRLRARKQRAAAGSGDAGVQLLEDFTSMRLNLDTPATDIWWPYQDDDVDNSSGQVLTLETNPSRLQVTVPANHAAYWYFKPGVGSQYGYPESYSQYYLRSGTWDPDNNRLGFLVRLSVNFNGNANNSDNLQVGMYIRDHQNNDPGDQGSHPYHKFNIYFTANRWVKVICDRHPGKENPGGTNDPQDDPFFASMGEHYFDALQHWYYDMQGGPASAHTWDMARVVFWKDTQDGDAREISNVYGYYTGTQYRVGFNNRDLQTHTFDIRYSTSNLHTNGFTSGTSGGQVDSTGDNYTGCNWTSGALAEQSPGLFVGIRRVGQTAFRQIWIPANMSPTSSPLWVP